MKRKKAFLLSAILLLLSSCSKAANGQETPENAVTAIPFGESIRADLDGDGVAEEITMRVSPQATSGSWRTALPELTVGETVFDGDYFYRLIEGGRLDAEAWYLLDIDPTDSCLELGLFREYIPQHAETVLLRYRAGELTCIGSFGTKLLDSPLQFCADEEPDWQSLREGVSDNIKADVVPGDGTVRCIEACNILERDSAPMIWELEEKEELYAALVPAKQEFFELQAWNDEWREKLLKTECRFYAERGIQAGEKDDAAVTLVAGTKIRFQRYYRDGGWIEMTYEDGANEGIAWFQIVREWQGGEEESALIRLPDREVDAAQCFEGFRLAGVEQKNCVKLWEGAKMAYEKILDQD